ncbi:hypothetical protein [Xenorhabdus koppenhoeferi]|uniref:Uncharacterized protein n=1 Tax=Xenorhabdus koppenhoeferi TaxID=351659 RepID=A0A1I7J1M2_9GAMM|nr:hypothetical protein [Xenorhabdus koppenhoeferi]SFU79099.1 hypothetical protein SAMN05421784_12625 [Xenorhabdus koppenhoeferi]
MMIISSTEFKNNDFLLKEHEFNEFGGNGDNRSPERVWTDVPAALSVEKLGIDAETTNAVARFIIQANTLATAIITSYYQR